jgi:hypothetical protein
MQLNSRATLTAALATALVTVVNTQPPAAKPAPSSATQLQQLAADIASVERDIRSAETETAQYSGGLVKSLVDLRLATLRQTRALLDQRLKAGSHAVSLRYTVDGKVLQAPTDLAGVESEIAATKASIEKQQAEAEKYSGGIVLAMALSTLATSRQTLAMLEQKRLAIKYGMPQFIGFAETIAASGSASTTPPRANAPKIAPAAGDPLKPSGLFEIVDIDSRVTESNETWSKFAWKLTVKNKSSQTLAFDATIEFLDSDGFVIDDDSEFGLVVGAGETKTFTGYDLVTSASATKVRSTNAKVRLDR